MRAMCFGRVKYDLYCKPIGLSYRKSGTSCSTGRGMFTLTIGVNLDTRHTFAANTAWLIEDCKRRRILLHYFLGTGV